MNPILVTLALQASLLVVTTQASAASIHNFPKQIKCTVFDPCKAISENKLGKCVDTFIIKTTRATPEKATLMVQVRENGIQKKTETYGTELFDGMSYPDWDSLQASWDSDMSVHLISPIESHFGYGTSHVSGGTFVYEEDFAFDVRQCQVRWW
jgi:hypothetical protein